MKKKILLLFLMVSACCMLWGCGKDKKPEKENPFTGTEDENSQTTDETNVNDGETVRPVDDETPPEKGMVRSVTTNEWITEELGQTRPIAVMYPINKVALPQYGLDNIDIFYECLEEGKMSRQLAIMKDWQDLERIGNIRSIRDYFVYWALEWDSVIIHFGGPIKYVSDILLREDVDNINGTGGSEMGSDYGAYFRIPAGSRSEHTAYTSGPKILSAIEKANFSLNHRSNYYNENNYIFTNASNPNTLKDAKGVQDATYINMGKCFPVTKSTLEYNEEDGLYYKEIYGNPQVDAVSGNQLAFANVIAQNTYYERYDLADDYDYLKFKTHDTTRDGYYFTKGKAIHITWKKTSDYAPTKYYDDDGKEIVLNTGKTMIFIVEDGDEIIFN